MPGPAPASGPASAGPSPRCSRVPVCWGLREWCRGSPQPPHVDADGSLGVGHSDLHCLLHHPGSRDVSKQGGSLRPLLAQVPRGTALGSPMLGVGVSAPSWHRGAPGTYRPRGAMSIACRARPSGRSRSQALPSALTWNRAVLDTGQKKGAAGTHQGPVSMHGTRGWKAKALRTPQDLCRAHTEASQPL